MSGPVPWIVVPARYGSSRLPGKPLADIGGKPLVLHVLAIAQSLVGADRAVVATDDPRIGDVVTAASGRVVMTRPDHASGTDRAAEVAEILNLDGEDIVVNLQGDEPLLPPALVNQAVSALVDNDDADMATLACPITESEHLDNPNIVKVVRSGRGAALYFSRSPIPYRRSPVPNLPTYRHIGLYAYRVRALMRLSALPPAPLEEAEGLEQLRALAAGMHIHVSLTDTAPPHGVDTPQDLARVRAMFGE